MTELTDLTILGAFIAVFIPLMTAILQYRQSVQQEYDKNFRAIIEKLSAGKKEERVAAASSLGTFIKKGGRYYDESIDVLVNTISIELDNNVLNAIRGSLEKIEKKDFRDVIKKLLAIDRNFFVYRYPIESWKEITKNDIKGSEDEFKKVSSKEDESQVNKIILTNLENDIKKKQEMYSKFEKDLNELKVNDEFVTNFIASFLNVIDPPIKNLEFYKNSMDYIVWTDLELTQSKINNSAFSRSTMRNNIFNDVIIIDSVFTFSGISKSKFINCRVQSSLFDQVIFEDVDFAGSEFRDVFFAGADLTGVNFIDTKGLKEIYFYKAENIDKAKFDDEFRRKLDVTLKNLTEDEFKEYLNNMSELSKQRRGDLIATLDELKGQIFK